MVEVINMDDVRVRVRTRYELVCEECGWAWLVPLEAGVMEGAEVSARHWREEHE